MTIEDMLALLVASLKDDVLAEIEREGNVITVKFSDGTVRTVTVK